MPMPTINRIQKKPRKTENSEKRLFRKKYYNSTRWLKLRLNKLLLNPLCEMCEKNNDVVLAVDVHHIISFTSTDDPIITDELFYSTENLMSLCKKCHQKIHNTTK